MVLVAAHACVDERWVVGDEAANVALSIERNRGPKIEPGAMGQKICRHVLADSCQASGPAEHADLVVVALAEDIGARFDQQRNEVQVRGFCGEVQGIPVVAVVSDANVGAAIVLPRWSRQSKPYSALPKRERLMNSANCSTRIST